MDVPRKEHRLKLGEAAVAGCALLLAVMLFACQQKRIADTDGAYFAWDGQTVLCGVGLDDEYGNDIDNIREGMRSAIDRDAVLLFFGHKPGPEMPIGRIEAILDYADELGMGVFTFDDLAADPPPVGERAGVALTFDDAHVKGWYEMTEVFEQRGVLATFFVTRFDRIGAASHRMLAEMADAGHTIGSHSFRHLRAADYVEEHGLQAYMDEEVWPSVNAMEAEGFEVRFFAYPFGQRTSELDRELLRHMTLIRSINFTWPIPGLSDPCPD